MMEERGLRVRQASRDDTHNRAEDEGCLNEETLWPEAKLSLVEFLLSFAQKTI